jgi:hypothetical protein
VKTLLGGERGVLAVANTDARRVKRGSLLFSSEVFCCSLLVLRSLKTFKAFTTFSHEFYAVLLCTMQKSIHDREQKVQSMRKVSALAVRHRHHKACVTDLMTVLMSADLIQ